MTRVPLSQLTSRVRRWRCGQVGHLARNCQSMSGGTGGSWATIGPSMAASSQQNMQSSRTEGSSRASSKGYFVGFSWASSSGAKVPEHYWSNQKAACVHRETCDLECVVPCDLECVVPCDLECVVPCDLECVFPCGLETKIKEEEVTCVTSVESPNTWMEGQSTYFVTSPHLAVVDTGAVNGVVGTTQFLISCQMLQQHRLHAQIDRECQGAPSSLGGIAGGAEVVCTAVTRDSPLPQWQEFQCLHFFPLPLMKALGGVIHLPKQCVMWTEHDNYESAIVELPSGHMGCSILDGVEKFRENHPMAAQFQHTQHASGDLQWIRERARELLKKKNEKRAVHFELGEADCQQSTMPCSCLESNDCDQHGSSSGSGEAGADRRTSTTSSSRVCRHLGPERVELMGATNATGLAYAASSISAGSVVGVEGIGCGREESRWNLQDDPFKRISNHYDSASDPSIDILENTLEAIEGSAGKREPQRELSSTTEGKGQRSREMVQLRSMSDEMAKGGRRVSSTIACEPESGYQMTKRS
eukprot:5258903-Amphidinium_carterae.3